MTFEGALDAFHIAPRDDDAEDLYERAPCGYLSTTPDGTITKVNQTFIALTGYDRDELVGRRTFAELLSGGGRIYHETHYAPMLMLQDQAHGIALDIVRADGVRLPVLVNSVLERAPDGSPEVIRTAVFDATERRDYERELLLAKQRAEASEAHAQSLARTLQHSLLPPTPPHIHGLDLDAAYRSAGSGNEVGGDFYDIFEVGPDDWVVAIGDVCGKGVDAAIVTSLARYSLRGATVRLAQPSQTLASVNEVLLRHEGSPSCTIALVRLRKHGAEWIATSSAGGHPLPILCRIGARPSEVGTPGTLLGVLDAPVFHDTDLALQPGDAIVLYTDGVTEGRRGNDFYGHARLLEVVNGASASATTLVESILADVLQFQAGNPRDDIAVVAIRVPSN